MEVPRIGEGDAYLLITLADHNLETGCERTNKIKTAPPPQVKPTIPPLIRPTTAPTVRPVLPSRCDPERSSISLDEIVMWLAVVLCSGTVLFTIGWLISIVYKTLTT